MNDTDRECECMKRAMSQFSLCVGMLGNHNDICARNSIAMVLSPFRTVYRLQVCCWLKHTYTHWKCTITIKCAIVVWTDADCFTNHASPNAMPSVFFTDTQWFLHKSIARIERSELALLLQHAVCLKAATYYGLPNIRFFVDFFSLFFNNSTLLCI